ncbi:hypothetical protein BD311DRAFT_604901, partial [Dichomitus squalens]
IMVEVDEKEDDFMAGLDDWVVQPSLRPFLRARGVPSELYTHDTARSGDAYRLLFIKLTIAGEQTAIGISWHHTLGDATVLCRFMQYLSQCYQGDGSLPSPIPTFTKRDFAPPSESLLAEHAP